jgi:hypothetical protein
MTTHPCPPSDPESFVAPPTPTFDEHVGDEETAASVVGAATNTEIADEEMTMPTVTKTRRIFPAVTRALEVVLSHEESPIFTVIDFNTCYLKPPFRRVSWAGNPLHTGDRCLNLYLRVMRSWHVWSCSRPKSG